MLCAGGKANGKIKLLVTNSGKLVLLSGQECLWSSSPVEPNEATEAATASAQAAY